MTKTTIAGYAPCMARVRAISDAGVPAGAPDRVLEGATEVAAFGGAEGDRAGDHGLHRLGCRG